MSSRILPAVTLGLFLVGCEATAPEFPNNLPIADAGDDFTAVVGETVELDGTRSRDLDGDGITYRWTLVAKPQGSRATLNRTDVGRVTFYADRPGTYRASLQVGDGRAKGVVDEVAVTTTLPATPVCRITPGSLDFGTVPQGQSVTRTVTVENLGQGTLAGSLALAGCVAFAVDGASSYSLTHLQSAIFTLRFSPTGPGSFECDMTSSGCDPVPLRGQEGSGPNCSLQITQTNLGAAILDDPPVTTEVTVTNVGSGTLTGTLNITGSGDWSVVGSRSYSLGASASQTFTLQFSPSSVGFQSVVIGSGSAVCSTTVEAGATGLKSLIPFCDVSVESIDFGDVNYREFPLIEVTITNLGGENLSGQFGLSDCGLDFWLSGRPLDYFLETNEQATIQVNFLPTVEGPIACELTLSDPICGPIPITANGVDPMTPECILSTEELDYGGVTLGSTADLSFQLTNGFTGTLSGTPVLNDPAGVFSVVGGGGPFALGADETTTVTVRFDPADLETYNATLSLGTDCPPLPLLGTGGPPPVCSLDTTSLDFGSVTVGDSQDFSIRVTNTGGGTLSGSISENCASVTPTGTTSYALGAGEFVDVPFRFLPTARGTVDCAIDMGSACGPVPVAASVSGISFASELQPALNGSCVSASCHGNFTYANVVPGRVNLSSPASSVLLRKPACQVSHSGGCRSGWQVGQTNYNIGLQWIQQGAHNN